MYKRVISMSLAYYRIWKKIRKLLRILKLPLVLDKKNTLEGDSTSFTFVPCIKRCQGIMCNY